MVVESESNQLVSSNSPQSNQKEQRSAHERGQRSQHRSQDGKKVAVVSVLCVIFIIIGSLLIFIANRVTNGYYSGSKRKVIPDMVLPNTTLLIDKISDHQSIGIIIFQPYSIQFSWHSFCNDTHDFIEFVWNNDELDELHLSINYYNTFFNGISGFHNFDTFRAYFN